jgi:hypothetical protein
VCLSNPNQRHEPAGFTKRHHKVIQSSSSNINRLLLSGISSRINQAAQADPVPPVIRAEYFAPCRCSAHRPAHKPSSASSASRHPCFPRRLSPRAATGRARARSRPWAQSGTGNARDAGAGTSAIRWVGALLSAVYHAPVCDTDATTQSGEMISDLPAMHSTSLNSRSFSLRGVSCHTCPRPLLLR